MILSDLLGAEVRLEDHPVGHVIDVRLVADEVTTDQPMPRLRIHGFVVSPHAGSSTLGYERSAVRSPWPIAALERWRHRDSFLVPWADIQAVRARRVELRPGARRYEPTLHTSARRGPDFEDRQH
jgi:hypothetical protein